MIVHTTCPECGEVLTIVLKKCVYSKAYYNCYVCICGQKMEMEVKMEGWK